MSEIVTGTPAVVGFTNGNNHHGYQYQLGLTDKDQMFAMSIDNGEQTRDLLAATALNGVAIEKTGAASVLATTLQGMAGQLATEKTGAATILESAKNTAALELQASLNASELRLQAALLNSESRLEANRVAAASALAAATNQAALAAQIAECCCEQKALALEIEARGTRDKLALLQTQFLILSGGQTPVGRIAA